MVSAAQSAFASPRVVDVADAATPAGERLHIDECILKILPAARGHCARQEALSFATRSRLQAIRSARMGRRVAAWTSRSLTLELLDR